MRMPKAAWRDSSSSTRRRMSFRSGLRRHRLDDVEDADRDALEEALHAERLQLPRRRREQLVEQDLDGRRDRVEHAHLAREELRDHLDVADLVDHLRAGVPLLVHRRARVGQLAAELQGGLLAVQELRHRVRELVARGVAAGRRRRRPCSCEHAGEERGVLAREEPLIARERDRPVDVGLGVPLALLAALVELAQLFDLAAVLPGPVQRQRNVDVNALAQAGDLLFVDVLDDLEVLDHAALLGHQFFHC